MEHEPPEKNNYTYLNAHVPNNILRKEFAMCQLKNLSTCNYSFAIRLRHHCSFIYFGLGLSTIQSHILLIDDINFTS